MMIHLYHRTCAKSKENQESRGLLRIAFRRVEGLTLSNVRKHRAWLCGHVVDNEDAGMRIERVETRLDVELRTE